LNLLELPTELFGLRVSDFSYASKEVDAFLNLAMTGPKIIASQFSSLENLGSLSLIIIPINFNESIVISSTELDMLYYFSIPSEQCTLSGNYSVIIPESIPEIVISSRRRFQFGKMLMRSSSLYDLKLEEVLPINDPEKMKEQENQTNQSAPVKSLKKQINSQVKVAQKIENMNESHENSVRLIAQLSASFFVICELIAQKFTPNFQIPKCYCVFENGIVSFLNLFDSESIATILQLGSVEFGSEFQKLWKKITESVDQLVDMHADSESE
jgi:hypothetical protein